MAYYDYTTNTVDGVITKMLAACPSGIDTREGSLVYNAVSAVASELVQCYYALQNILDECDPSTASISGLQTLGSAFGLELKEATPAKIRVKILFTDESNPDMTGYSFTSVENGLTYTCDGRFGNLPNNWTAICDTPGTEGTLSGGMMLPTAEITNFGSAQVLALIEAGGDEETTEEFRQRYYNALTVKPFAGNIDYYKQTVGELDGVGAVQVHPVWNGGGTVNVCVISDDKKEPVSEEKLAELQLAIDPTQSSAAYASGAGIAPIDHVVTVSTPEYKTIDIDLTVEGEGYTTTAIWNAIEEYFSSLIDDWANENDYGKYSTIIYRAQIIAKLASLDGITDVTINKPTSSVTLVEVANKAEGKVPQLPKLGVLTVNGEGTIIIKDSESMVENS